MSDLVRQVAQLNALARARLQERHKRQDEHLAEVDQMLRLGLCPCIVMGRYSTCCEPKLGDLR